MVMEREELQMMLEAGMSLAAIGRETGRHPSTVSYWVAKHGLSLSESARHAPRGVIPEDVLRRLVAEGKSTREIASVVDRSQATVRYRLRRLGMATVPRAAGAAPRYQVFEGTCPRHGQTRMTMRKGTQLCLRCRSESVASWRRRAKAILVAEAGGGCAECGYARCAQALQFHHRDPATKRFTIADRGLTRSIDVLREEAAKCILLCSNCHAEVEAGVRRLP